MANSERRAGYTDRYNKMFIPMNVEGGTWNESFITTPKLAAIGAIFASLIIMIIYLGSAGASARAYIVCIAIWLLISITVTRFIIFEEKFYYRMYEEIKVKEITTPSIFWDVASVKDTDEGAIITYSDAKIAVIVKLDRDTITGKEVDFKETHFDALSDFYKSLAQENLSFISMNIMESAGNDPRLDELSKLVYKSDNPNICRLMEMEVGYIKNITRMSLYETEYLLIYTTDLSKLDNYISIVCDCLFKLLDGAYVGYKVLSSKEVGAFVKEEYKVNYFNYTEASLNMYKNNAGASIEPFKITGILWEDGEEQELNNNEVLKLRNLTSKVIKETIKKQDVSLKQALYRKDDRNKIGIDFNNLSKDKVSIEKKSIETEKEEKGIIEIGGEEYIDL